MAYSSINKLSQRMGVSRSTVSEWLKHKRFPIHRTPPWSEADAEVLDEWRTTLQANRGDASYHDTKASTDPADKEFWLSRKYRAQALQQEARLIETDAMLTAWHEVRDMADQAILGIADQARDELNLSEAQTDQLRTSIAGVLAAAQDRVVGLAEESKRLEAAKVIIE